MRRYPWRATVGTRVATWLAAVGSIVALAAALGTPVARADGDPASDVLVSSDLYQPWDVPTALEPRLLATLSAASHAGFPIRVALIGSASPDLGTVTPLWRKPAEYAYYLGTELSLTFTGPVMVVMPDGYGLYGHLTPAMRTALSELKPPGGGAGLVGGAIAAVGRLAAAAGHPLPTAIGGGQTGAVAGGSSDAGDWIAFWIGAGAIALAWGFSLRARPLQLRRRTITDPR